MQKKLRSLSHEMAKKGYPATQDFQDDGRYHLFELNGNIKRPGYYKIELTSSGLSAVYGDFVTDNVYHWSGDPLSPEEAEELKRRQDKASVEFEKMLQREYEEFKREAILCWNEGKCMAKIIETTIEVKKVKTGNFGPLFDREDITEADLMGGEQPEKEKEAVPDAQESKED